VVALCLAFYSAYLRLHPPATPDATVLGDRALAGFAFFAGLALVWWGCSTWRTWKRDIARDQSDMAREQSNEAKAKERHAEVLARIDSLQTTRDASETVSKTQAVLNLTGGLEARVFRALDKALDVAALLLSELGTQQHLSAVADLNGDREKARQIETAMVAAFDNDFRADVETWVRYLGEQDIDVSHLRTLLASGPGTFAQIREIALQLEAGAKTLSKRLGD
jgi:hypothetical protein